jgi:hypothetical protein
MPIRRNSAISGDQLKALLARFEADTSVDENGTLHFRTLDTNEQERILPDAFDVDPALTRRQGRHILRDALRMTRKTGPLTSERVLAEAQRMARERLALQLRPYAMWTKFRANQMAFNPGFSVSWNDVTLESANELPDYMYQEDYFLSGHGDISPRQPAFFGHLIARGAARDEDSAADLLMDAMDVFMAIFNVYASYGIWSIGSSLATEGRLWSGPYHFLFEEERFLGHDQVWFDPFFDDDAWRASTIDMATVLKIMPRISEALAALASHPMRDILVRILRLMQEAMSSRDEKFVLLRYWSALEQLYGEPNSRTKDYRRMIQRAVFAEADKVLARWKLTHISGHRNEYVHAGSGEDDLRIMSQHLRRMLSRHINYLLFLAPWVRSHSHWLEFVDLPDNAGALEAHKATIDHRIDLVRKRNGEKEG